MFGWLVLVFAACGCLCSCSQEEPKGIHFGPGPSAEDNEDSNY